MYFYGVIFIRSFMWLLCGSWCTVEKVGTLRVIYIGKNVYKMDQPIINKGLIKFTQTIKVISAYLSFTFNFNNEIIKQYT